MPTREKVGLVLMGIGFGILITSIATLNVAGAVFSTIGFLIGLVLVSSS